MPKALDTPTRERIREELEAIPAVQRAVIDGPPWNVYLVCEAGAAAAGPVEAAAAAVLSRVGLPAAEVKLHTSFLTAPEPRRRVRFVEAQLRHPQIGVAAGRVLLEWQDEIFEGSAEGPSSMTLDLRVSALATLDAVRKIVPSCPPLHLLGIKGVRVFDHELIVVLLRWGENADHPLVGTARMAADPARPAAIAVLNALNRLLGNYLAVSD
jgi:hypothetical protein